MMLYHQHARTRYHRPASASQSTSLRLQLLMSIVTERLHHAALGRR